MRDQIMSEFLKALAAREPAPGGGATAALHVAQAAALAGMAARFTDDLPSALEADRLRLHALRLAEKAAHAATVAARARTGEAACRVAAEVIDTAREVLSLLERLAPVVGPAVVTDVVAAAEAVRAAVSTSRVSIEVNSGGGVDGVDELCERAERVTAAVRAGV